MKNIVILISCFFLQKGTAQKTEISVGINGNLSFFRGPNTASINFFTLRDTTRSYSYGSDKDYSKVLSFGVGVEGLIQRVFKDNFLVGFAGGAELLSGRIKIYDFDAGFTNPKQLGQSIITQTFINLYPFFGRRFKIKPYSFDIDLGLEMGIPLTAHEKTKVTSISGNKTLEAERDRRKVLDLRPRMQFRLQRNKYGAEAGFALGTTDYANVFFGKTYSAIIRLGVFYRLK